MKESKLIALLDEIESMLSSSNSYSEDYPKDSIMAYGRTCTHDDGFMCEHRVAVIRNFLYKKLK